MTLEQQWLDDMMILAVVAMLLTSCSTASKQNERITVEYQLTTGNYGQGTWVLPKGALVFVRNGRGYTDLDWEAGGPLGVQKIGGTLKSNVVDARVLRREPTQETRD
jgi:hypothetical protein